MMAPITKSQALLLAIRPKTLLTGLAPVLLGLAFGLKQVLYGARPLRAEHLLVSVLACLLVVFLQSAANLVNDAKDAEKGVDTASRVGPLRVVQAGLLSRQLVRSAYLICFVFAAAIVGWMFYWTGDWIVPGVAAVCALAAYAYTAGPYPLAYYALGELVALIFFGPIAVMGSAYLQTGVIDWSLCFWGLGCGFISAAIMAINNYRDRAQDARARKTTLATQFGALWARRLPVIFIFLSALIMLIYCTKRDVVGLGVLGCAGAYIYTVRRILPALRGQGAELNQALQATAQFNLFYALFFILCVSQGNL